MTTAAGEKRIRVVDCNPNASNESEYVKVYAINDENEISSLNLNKKVSVHLYMPWNHFHDVFWGKITPKELILSGEASIGSFWECKNLAQFSYAFDFTTNKWNQC